MPEETAVLDTPVTPAVETTPEVTSETTEPDHKPAEPKTDKIDRRQTPDALRKTLKWLKENGGEHSPQAQEIERALGELKSWKTVAGNVREAREIKAAIDAVGGREKLAELQQYSTHMREVDSLIEAGDERALPMVLETPQARAGVAKLLPGLLKELGKSNAAEVTAAIQPHISGYLESQGFTEAIDEMVGHFNENEPAKAKAVLAKIVNWWKAKMGQSSSEKPAEQQEWEKERQTFQQERFAGDVSKVFDASMAHAEQSIDKELTPYLKQYNIPKDTAEIVRGDVWKRIEKERNADSLFKARIADLVNERSRKVDPQTADFLKSQVDQRVKDAVRKEIQLRYGFIKKGSTDPEKKLVPTAAPTTGVTVSIDYDKTFAKYGGEDGGRSAIIRGKAVNSAGKDIMRAGKVWKLA